MTWAFSSWQDFFAMGGYGFYVWIAVAATLLPLAGLVLHTMIQRRQLLAEVRRRGAREQRIAQARKREETASERYKSEQQGEN